MLGRADARGGNFAESEERLRDALTQLEEMGSEFHASETEAWLAESFVFGGRYREASELLEPLLTNNSAALRSLLERLFGYAIVQSRAPLDGRSRTSIRASRLPERLAPTTRSR